MIIRGRSGEVTIRERLASAWGWVLLIAFCFFGMATFFLIAAVDSHNYRTLAAQLAVLVAVLAGLCIRVTRIGIRFDERGVTVRNFWRTRRLGWGQVSQLADGGSGWEWAIRVVSREGRAVTANGTRSQVIRETRTVKPETLTAIGEIAERYGVSLEVAGRPPTRPAGTDDGTVVIHSHKYAALLASEDAIIVRRGRRVERLGWAEISRFGNGGRGALALEIVLRTGRTIHVPPAIELTDGELAAAIQQLAVHHDIPVDLAGLPPQPVQPGLFEDPCGEEGLRYWDGVCWSPLLPRGVARRAQPAVASWSELPMAEGAWTYAAGQAKQVGIWSAVSAGLTAALAAVGLAVDLVWDRGAHPRQWTAGGWFSMAALSALTLGGLWIARRRYRKIDRAARDSAARARGGLRTSGDDRGPTAADS